jgi:Rps23 Pro-64 3,4-dihydroxylase Tpa1-like proline 4-hydroxylase
VLSGSDYRGRMAELTGMPLDDAAFTLDVWEYRTGDWRAPHVDKADKLVTQIFYFTGRWTDEDGGRLLILRTNDALEPVHALPPVLGSSAILLRFETSWHAVQEAPGAAGASGSITATFWRDHTGPVRE